MLTVQLPGRESRVILKGHMMSWK